jgi:hypothetical protein
MSGHVALASAERSKRWWDELQAVPLRWRSGARCGTAYLSLESFARRFGNPHVAAPVEDWRRYDDRPLSDGAGKVSASWWFDTPRGLVEVSDYWWNGSEELGVRATDRRALRWFLRYLREREIRAEFGARPVSAR